MVRELLCGSIDGKCRWLDEVSSRIVLKIGKKYIKNNRIFIFIKRNLINITEINLTTKTLHFPLLFSSKLKTKDLSNKLATDFEYFEQEFWLIFYFSIQSAKNFASL